MRTLLLSKRGAAMAAALAATSTGLSAAEVVLAPVADTTLVEARPLNNLGAEINFHSGTSGVGTENRGLLRFDLSQIPTDAVIQAVALRLEVTVVPNTGDRVGSQFQVHRVLQAWGEGTGSGHQGTTATTGAATWSFRSFPTLTWAAGGAQAGTDYVSTPSAARFMDALGSYVFDSTAGLVADVQFWLNNPAANFGWIVVSDDEATEYTARRFGSRENATAAARPRLTVQYTMPLAPPRIDLAEVSGGQFRLGFQAAAGHAYVVERRDTVASSSWLVYTNLPAVPTNRTIIVSAPLSGVQQFYRVGRQ